MPLNLKQALARAGLLAALAAAPCIAQAPADPAKEKEALARAAITGYVANVKAFPSYRCRFKHTRAQARSVADALEGKFVNAASYESRVLKHGDKYLQEDLGSTELPKQKGTPMRGRPGLSIVPATTSSQRYLADGKRELG